MLNGVDTDVRVYASFIACNSQRNLAEHLVQLLFQSTHTAFASVVFDDVFDGGLRHLHVLSSLQSVGLLCLLDKMPACNLNLLFRAIARDLNQLHSVEERTRNLTNVVGCGYEHNLRQVIVHIEEVIVESRVLLRVEYLQKSGRRVAIHGSAAYLIYLIEDEHRVVGAGLNDALEDASRHSADVRASVTTNLSFIVQSA